MLAIYRKEIRSYFINPIGYIYLGVFLVFSALLCCYTTLISASYSTSSYFTYLTAPVTITGMVMGKYLAALTLYVGGILISCVNFIPLYIIGAAERAGESDYALTHIGPVTGEIVGSVIAVILLGAALIAVGTLISALTENQLSAAVITVGVIAVMVLLNVFNLLTDSDGQPIIGSYAVRFVISWVSVISRFSAFSQGVFDYSALLYYVSLAFIFLFLTVRVYEKRRWG